MKGSKGPGATIKVLIDHLPGDSVVEWLVTPAPDTVIARAMPVAAACPDDVEDRERGWRELHSRRDSGILCPARGVHRVQGARTPQAGAHLQETGYERHLWRGIQGRLC